MRELKLPMRTTQRTSDVLNAIAWASARRGNVPWEHNDVPQEALNYLNTHKVDVLRQGITRERIHRLMCLADSNGLAHAKFNGSRGTISWFQFAPDVDLSKATVTGKVLETVVGTASPTDSMQARVTRVMAKQTDTELPELPLPTVPVVRWKAEEINTLLDAYSEADPEAYASYADRLCEVLKVVTGG
jgi:deoxycytidylate deaminase